MAKRFSADYTAEDILGLYKTRSQDGDEGRLRLLSEKFRALCRLEHEVQIPPQYKAISREVRTPFIRDSWLRITSSLVHKSPVVHITPKDEQRREYREAANLGERWDMALIERTNKQLGSDIIFNLTAQLVRDGESVLKVVHKPDAWANFPEGVAVEDQDTYKRGVDLPLAWRDVDRLCIVREGGEYGDQWVLEYGEYPKPYLRSKYAMRDGPDKGRLVNPKNILTGREGIGGLQGSSTGYSTKAEFVTPREWHVLIDGSEAPGFPKPNPYNPYLHYFFSSCYDSESLLYSLMFLVPRLDELLTMKLNWSVLGAYPSPVIETMPGANGLGGMEFPLSTPPDAPEGGQPKPLTWAPGKAMDLPVGKRISFLTPPPVGGDLNDLIGIFKSLIDIAGVPSIMRGTSGSGDSGYLGAQMRDAAEMAYKLASRSGGRQVSQALEFTHWLVANKIKQTVYVYGWDALNPKTGKPTTKAGNAWLGLSPDAESKNIAPVSKLGPVEVAYRPTMPTNEQANAMIAMQLTNAQKPLSGVRHALEKYLQEEDPESIMDEIAVEDALQQQPLASLVLEKALKEAGLLPPNPPAPNPAQQLVGPNGQPIGSGMLPPGPGQLQPVPLANQAPPGVPGVPGLTMPISPTAPQGPGGVYPGQPGGPQLR